MKLIIDERETALYDRCNSILFCEGTAYSIQLIKRVLPLGDILIQTDEDKDVMLIERKTLSDLLSSVKDGRYEEQSYRLMHSSGFPLHSVIYLIEGMYTQLRSSIEKKIVYSSITSLHFFKGFSVFRTSSLVETAETIINMAQKIDRDFQKGKIPYYLSRPYYGQNPSTISICASEPAKVETGQINSEDNSEGGSEDKSEDKQSDTLSNSIVSTVPANYCTVVKQVKKENVTPANIGEIILCQIPGISSVTALAIMKNYDSFPHFLEELQKNPNCLENVSSESKGKIRKINKTCIQNIKLYLLKVSV
jgi:ERCC4-type nuclease